MFNRIRRVNLFLTSISLKESIQLILFSLYYLFFIRVNFFSKRKENFSRKFSINFKNKYKSLAAITVPSARVGLLSILSAMNIGKGDEVLITGYSCSAVAESLLFLGIKPVYVDIDLKNYGIDALEAKKLITSNTKAIIVQHTFGIPANMNRIKSLASEYDLKVVEDCALALGSKDGDHYLGTFGDASIFSFEISKTISVGWGGLILINNDKKLEVQINDFVNEFRYLSRLKSFKCLFQAGISSILYNHNLYKFGGLIISFFIKIGFFKKSEIVFNKNKMPDDYLSHLPEIQWLVLDKLFNRLDDINDFQKSVSIKYYELLKEVGCNMNRNLIGNYALIRFPILVKEKDRILKFFESNGVELGSWFSHPVTVNKDNLSNYDYVSGSCKKAEFASKHIINLPTHNRLNHKDLKKICNLLKNYFTSYPEEIDFVNNNQ